jgi:hypothetical protein
MAIAAAAMAGVALIGAAPANAQVDMGIHVPGAHVGVGVVTPAFSYGPVYYPPGPCESYNYYYQGDCGYAVYNGPIELEGVAIDGPHYYRWFSGQPVFWYRGGWHSWDGWTQANFGWDHGEGWGWHDGHWDRGWGNDHWHGGVGDRDARDYDDDHTLRRHHYHAEDHRVR